MPTFVSSLCMHQNWIHFWVNTMSQMLNLLFVGPNVWIFIMILSNFLTTLFLWTAGHFIWRFSTYGYVFIQHKTSKASSSLFSTVVCLLYIFTTRFGPLLFFLASRLFRDEDTYSEVRALCAVLVLHQDAVLAGVRRVYAGDGETGKLARRKLEDAVGVRRDLLIVLQPGDLWHGVARNVAGEIESLRDR